MSAEYATDAAPRWSVTAWVDSNWVFIQIPIKGKAPFIAKYPLTTQGLGEALHQMKKYHTIEAGPPQYTIPPRLPSTPSNHPDSTRAKALAILRKHGIL